MLRPILVLCAALAVSVGVAAAQQRRQVERTPIDRTPAYDGATMFQSYCSACHGPEGKGDGPVASSLVVAPADLTKITERNGGTFPAIRIARFIAGSDEVLAHGTRDMPLWGPLFRSLGDGVGELRVNNLRDYLRSIQQ